MIELTSLNGTRFCINPDMIEEITASPDTVITMNTGRKFIVKETRQEVKSLVLSYKREIFADLFRFSKEESTTSAD